MSILIGIGLLPNFDKKKPLSWSDWQKIRLGES